MHRNWLEGNKRPTVVTEVFLPYVTVLIEHCRRGGAGFAGSSGDAGEEGNSFRARERE
jgi:hypothetical protein